MYLESSDDDQVLLCISFKQLVSIKSIGIISMGTNSPKVIKMFADRSMADFDEAETAEPSALLDLEEEGDGKLRTIELSEVGNEALFKNIREMTIFVQGSHGGDKTVIGWLGLLGENGSKVGVVEDATYELRPLNGFQTMQTTGPRYTTGF